MKKKRGKNLIKRTKNYEQLEKNCKKFRENGRKKWLKIEKNGQTKWRKIEKNGPKIDELNE